ncbi:patatin-like phospholipase family protein [Campylobacter geochelonis]|uniref:NTE family protein rssA n=1 Tax=Campylobacter geochelonis TaxID=1780362 RepID=A0A128ENF8_9BACT|nr:patatin-like phospholipase family protein [Campylobacter geochelonis]QKF70773.1 Patatin-like phospholipase [Campylobacter geochelonis]CZE47315.1 NTE family protein rssA [Campylobacter geochelonis]CZE48636.1 NTE family protein rssA [Campylobacter geochelonis]CZE50542.1 NTE family protein rssA [Campylobacter geochelonis]
MQIALSLSGGAARGVFHLGVLAKFDEVGIEVGAISGSSIGSMIGVCYAAGMGAKEILKVVKTKEFKKVFKINLPYKSLVKIDKNANAIKELLQVDRLENLLVKTYVGCVDLYSGKMEYFSSGDTLKIVLGSCALVPIFEPIRYENYLLADGGFMDNMPLAPLKKHKLKIVGVDLHPTSKFSPKSSISYTTRALSLMMSSSIKRQQNSCDVYISNPNLANFSLFSFKNFDEMFELGYNSVNKEIIKKIKERV